MYSIIQTYINAIITLVNSNISGTLSDLKEIDIAFDIDKAPSNQLNNYYRIAFSEIEAEDFESYSFDRIGIELELSFLLSKDKDNYKNAIDCVNLIKQQLKKSVMSESTNYQISGVENVKCTGLNNITDNNWLKPLVKFDLRVVDTQ